MTDKIKKAISLGIDGSVAKLAMVAKLSVPSRTVFPVNINLFDNATDGGFREGELITISGMSGQGKTTYTLNLAIRLSELSVQSLYFSYEMDAYYLHQSFLRIKNEEMLVYAPVDLVSGKLDFIEKQIQEGISKKAIKVVFIDHLHFLIDMKDSKNSSLFIGGIVRELKRMAVRNKIIIFLIAHTKKIGAEEVLGLSSVRDSGMIVAESDYVFLIERLKTKRDAIDDLIAQTGKDEFTNKGRVSLAKNRRTGFLVYQDFFVERGRFVEIDKTQDEPR